MFFNKMLVVGMAAMIIGQCSGAADDSSDFQTQSDSSYFSDRQEPAIISAQPVEITDAQKKKNEMLVGAAKAGNAKKITTLLAQRADVDAVDVDSAKDSKWGYSALHRATQEGHVDAVLVLLEAKASIDSKANAFGNTALHEASKGNNIKMVQLLLDHGASIGQPNNTDSRALHLAAREGKTDVVRLLLSKGACIDAVNDQGYTPLHQAASWGHGDTVSVLLEAGACADKLDCRGLAPFGAAVFGHNPATISILLDAYYAALVKKCTGIIDTENGNPENKTQEVRTEYAAQLKNELIACVKKGADEAQWVSAPQKAKQAMEQLFQTELANAQGLKVDKLLQGNIVCNGQLRLIAHQPEAQPAGSRLACSCPCAIS